jgi:hypothetical protein
LLVEGFELGILLNVGRDEGFTEGVLDGAQLGKEDRLGLSDGLRDGWELIDGRNVGATEGDFEGILDGEIDGMNVG